MNPCRCDFFFALSSTFRVLLSHNISILTTPSPHLPRPAPQMLFATAIACTSLNGYSGPNDEPRRPSTAALQTSRPCLFRWKRLLSRHGWGPRWRGPCGGCMWMLIEGPLDILRYVTFRFSRTRHGAFDSFHYPPRVLTHNTLSQP